MRVRTTTIDLPLSGLTAELQTLSLRQALQADHDASNTERPEYIGEAEWRGLHRLACRVTRLGEQPGITIDELLDLPQVDTDALMAGAKEVQQLAERFRGAESEPAPGSGAGGEGDGMVEG